MIFGKKRERHPLEPIQEPIRLGGRPNDAVKPGDDPVPVRPADMPPAPPALLADDGRAFAPHCDQRILHAPGDCWACDLYPDWQKLRVLWGIAFTGHKPVNDVVTVESRKAPIVVRRELPCPADYNRPPDSSSDHRQWGPNTAQGSSRG